MTVAEMIAEMGYEDVIIFSEPSYDDAFLGVTDSNQAVYDYDLMVEWLISHDGMTEEEAADFISYNASFGGTGYPIILYKYSL